MASILTGHVTHWACLGCSGSAYTTACSSSCQYPATSHSHWRGVDQHSTGHNQQPDQLYAKEMCCTAWGKWWSHQILTGFRTPPDPPRPPNKAKLHVSEWPFIVASLRHTCAIIMLSNQHLDMPHLWGGMDYLGKGEVLTITDLDRFVNNIWEKCLFCVYRKCFRSLSSSHEKWEQKQKCCIYIFVQCSNRHRIKINILTGWHTNYWTYIHRNVKHTKRIMGSEDGLNNY